MVDAGAHVGAEVIGATGGWGLVVHHGHAAQTLSATRGQPRTWRPFETLAGYLKDLGITEVRVNTAAFEPGPTTGKQDQARKQFAAKRAALAKRAAPKKAAAH